MKKKPRLILPKIRSAKYRDAQKWKTGRKAEGSICKMDNMVSTSSIMRIERKLKTKRSDDSVIRSKSLKKNQHIETTNKWLRQLLEAIDQRPKESYIMSVII